MSLLRYIDLVEKCGGEIRSAESGSIPSDLSPILGGLGLGGQALIFLLYDNLEKFVSKHKKGTQSVPFCITSQRWFCFELRAQNLDKRADVHEVDSAASIDIRFGLETAGGQNSDECRDVLEVHDTI